MDRQESSFWRTIFSQPVFFSCFKWDSRFQYKIDYFNSNRFCGFCNYSSHGNSRDFTSCCSQGNKLDLARSGSVAWRYQGHPSPHSSISTASAGAKFDFWDARRWQVGFIYLYKNQLTHCMLNRLSHTIYLKSPISILGTSGYEIYIFLEKNG